MNVTFSNWESGYTFFFNGKQVGAGLYEPSGFELIEDDNVSTHANGMSAFCYLKAKYESNSLPLKQSTIDLFTPGKRINLEGERGRYLARSSSDSCS